jgi:hypothetical protein
MMSKDAPVKDGEPDFCVRCSSGNLCETGKALERAMIMAENMHMLENNDGRRRKRLRAVRAWQYHVDGKYEQVNIVLPEKL